MLTAQDFFEFDQSGHDAAELTRSSLSDAREIMGVAFDALPLTLLFHSAQGILHANAAAGRLFAQPPSALIGQHILDHVASDDIAAVTQALDAGLRAGEQSADVEAVLRQAGGSDRLCRITLVRLPWPGNPMVQMVVNDITDQRRAEASMRQLTITDELTGAYNRRHLFYEALLYVESFKSTGNHFSVGVVDIDHFKSVNDTYGHAAGDDALRKLTACAHTFLPTVRGTDSAMFARIGGEEFVLLLPGLGQKRAAAELDRFRLAVADLNIVTDAGAFQMTISIGVSEIATGDESFETILGRADAALYKAKHGGRNKVVISG